MLTNNLTIPTKKVFIDHLDKMKPHRFLEFVEKLESEYDSVLSSKSISITEKIDGSALRVGLCSQGKVFIESSTSQSMFTVGDFYARDLAKGYSGEIGSRFDSVLERFIQDREFQDILTKYNQTGIKVIGEMLYLPMGDMLDDRVRFIRIAYKTESLGSPLTFVPFSIIDGNGNAHADEQLILDELCTISNKQRKILKPDIRLETDIDLSSEIKILRDEISKDYTDIKNLLVSRKKIDSEQKQYMSSIIAEYQKQMGMKILSYIKTGLFGPDFEGIVIKLKDGSILKLVSDKFKNESFQKNGW